MLKLHLPVCRSAGSVYGRCLLPGIHYTEFLCSNGDKNYLKQVSQARLRGSEVIASPSEFLRDPLDSRSFTITA